MPREVMARGHRRSHAGPADPTRGEAAVKKPVREVLTAASDVFCPTFAHAEVRAHSDDSVVVILGA